MKSSIILNNHYSQSDAAVELNFILWSLKIFMSIFLLVIVLYFLAFTVNVMSVVFKVSCSVG